MTISRQAQRAVCVAAIYALLSGCSAAYSPASRGLSAIAMSNSLGVTPVRHLYRGKSWMRKDAGKQWLLYVSDGSSGTIDVYNYRVKAGRLYGQLTGLNFPYGQCVDRSGDVYVVDNGTSKIYEFAHGGTTPIATATDDYGSPIGCSVDATTGDVAVGNFSSTGNGAGGIDVFAGGLQGSQTNYTDPNLFRVFPPGYDPSGNLFVQATDYSGTHEFAELPNGSRKFTLLSGLTVGFPGAVAWDGYYLTATDQNYQYAYTTMIYRITVSGSAVKTVRATQLTDDCYPGTNWMVAVQPFVTGTTGKLNAVAAGNLNCPNRQNFFNYTNGGNPKRTLPSSIAPIAPYGQSVSPPGSGGKSN
jgi:hypothetical protein